MEFIFQVLAELFSPVDEDQGKRSQIKEMAKVEEKKEVAVQTEKTEEEKPNLFGLMEFH